MPKYWFDHIHFLSPDPLKTAEFYEKMVGATRLGVRKIPDGRNVVDLVLNGSDIKVVQPRDEPLVPGILPTGYGLEHFGLRTDDIEAAAADLKSKGVKFVMDVTQFLPNLKIAFFLGPENVLIELLERKD